MRCTNRATIVAQAILLIALAARPCPAADTAVEYPKTQRGDQVDDYHGTKLSDPYRWLEQDVRESKDVAAWVTAENEVTARYLSAIPEREAIRRRVAELWNFARYSAPRKEGGRYYYLKNDGLQNQSVLYAMDSLGGEPRVLLDPNTWSKDGTVALAGTSYSDDGKYLAYCVAEAGSDWQTWRVLEIASGKVLDDRVRWAKFTGAAWTKDGKGFFYGRYDEPPPGKQFQQVNLNQKLYFHRVCTPQQDDVLAFAQPDHPEWTFHPEVTEDGRYLVITVQKSTDQKHRIFVKDLSEPYGVPLAVIDEFANEYSFVGSDGPLLFFLTDLDAPRKRVVAIDLRNPKRESFRQIIPQAEETLLHASLVGNLLVTSYLKDVRPQVKLFTLSGEPVREVQFPGIGSATGFGGHRSDTETFYEFSSPTTPPAIYRYDLITGQSRLLRRAEIKFQPDAYEIQQVFYQSKDGTRVPMFVAHRKGLKLDGSNPTLLYGYGGFAIAVQPQFSVKFATWLDLGGVLAIANLRGGAEYGELWHLAGKRRQKQNVFDDFIAAAQWLIDHKYTRPEKLAIHGGSNGGLLVGAVMTQRPELFGACLPAVGVMDMLRYHRFTAGRLWADEYGTAADAEMLPALVAYSPYQNLKRGTKYPATLVTTADTDDRVVPAHSFKFAAALQHAQAGDAPVLIRIETRAGHGAGKPTTKLIDEAADQWAFLAKNLGIELPQ
jgi:prolyl oligopeptidase